MFIAAAISLRHFPIGIENANLKNLKSQKWMLKTQTWRLKIYTQIVIVAALAKVFNQSPKARTNRLTAYDSPTKRTASFLFTSG